MDKIENRQSKETEEVEIEKEKDNTEFINLERKLDAMQKQLDNNYVISMMLLGMHVFHGFSGLCRQ
jgi:hypothetical protein